MNAPYRMPDVAGRKELSPEDEMRLILARADEKPLKLMLVRRSLMFVVAAVCVARGDLEWIFWVVLDAAWVACIVHGLTRRTRWARRLRKEGIVVPASFGIEGAR